MESVSPKHGPSLDTSIKQAQSGTEREKEVSKIVKEAFSPPPLTRGGPVTKAGARELRESIDTFKELLNTARGLNSEQEVRTGKIWKKVKLDLPQGKGTFMITKQAANDIDRQPVEIGGRLYPTVERAEAKETKPTSEEELTEGKKIRRGELLDAVCALFPEKIDNDRAGEVLALLCSQSVLGPLERTALDRYCPKNQSGKTISALIPDNDYPPVLHSLKVESDSLVFTTVMHYVTRAVTKPPPKGFTPEHIKTNVEIRIPLKTIMAGSMETLSSDQCDIEYGITKIG